MLPNLGLFISKVFRVYIGALKKLIPYFILLSVLFVFVFFYHGSTGLLFFFIPGTYIRFIIYVFGLVFFSFFTFVLTLSVIRMIGNFYSNQTFLKFGDNIKESLKLGFKNIFALLLLSVPSILVYLVYILGFMGYLSVYLIAIFYFLIILLGVLFFLWLPFVIVAIALEKQKVFQAIKTSVSMVKGRVWSIFIRLFLPALLIYTVFSLFSYVEDVLLGSNIFALFFIFILSLLILPFGVIVPTILYLEAKMEPFVNKDTPPERI